MAPCIFHGPLLCHAHPMLDLCEDLLDGIEVRGVGWQEPQACPCTFDDLSDNGSLMASEIVQNDDIARLERWQEHLFDIGAERRAVDRAVKDARCGQSITAQGTQEGHGAPMAVRGIATQPLALLSPSPDRRHIGLDPGFIDEHQTPGIEIRLPALEAFTPSGDVAARLLRCEQCFF